MSKGTPVHALRVDDVTWAKAQTKAQRHGTTASAKARELLTAWADDEDEPSLADAWDEGYSYGDEYPINPYR